MICGKDAMIWLFSILAFDVSIMEPYKWLFLHNITWHWEKTSFKSKVYKEGSMQEYSKCCCNFTDCWIRCRSSSNRYYYFDIILKTASIIICLSTPWTAMKNSLVSTNIKSVHAKLTAAKRVTSFLQLFDDIMSMQEKENKMKNSYYVKRAVNQSNTTRGIHQ